MPASYRARGRAAWTNPVVAAIARACLTGAMRMTVVAPAADLAPFVREYTFVETHEEATRVLVPDGAAVAGFRFGGHACLLQDGDAIRMPDASFAGVRDTARRMRTS